MKCCFAAFVRWPADLDALTPRWLDRSLGLALTALAAFAITAMPLALAGWFRPAPVAIAWLAGWFAIWRISGFRSVDPGYHPGAAARRAGAVVLLVVLATTALNVRYSSQHLLTERDPGVYVNIARWLASEGELLVEPEREAYQGIVNEHRVRFASAGYYEGHRDDGKLYPQFVHLLPATIGAASWAVGERGMLKVNALLGGLALLVFFAFASTLVRPWAAAGATIALAFNLIQIHFSRDAYTEIPTQILLFGGLWVLLSARRELHAGRALLAGLLIGSASMARLDAFIFLVPLALYVVYELVSARPLARRHRGFLVALVAGAAVPSTVAFIDARFFSPVYLNDLWPSVRLVFVVVALVAVGGLVLVLAVPRLPALVEFVRSRRRYLGSLAAIAIVYLALVATFLRPHIQVLHQTNINRFVETLQLREGLAIDGTRTYAENTMRWLGLYLGPFALSGGIVGLALLARDVVRGGSKRAVIFLLAALPMTALYVWEPTITPDHPWALRRFLPITIPGLILCCFWLIDRYWPDDPARVARRAGLIVLAAGAVAFPAWTIAPVAEERTQRGLLTVIEKLCDYLPEDAAVVVAQTQLLDQNMTQTVRGFCDVPSANAPMDQPLSWYSEMARRWAAQGRSFYIVSPQKGFGLRWPPDVGEAITGVTFENLERTLTGRPEEYESFTLTLFARKIVP